jgi:hypothetical protein
VCEWRPLNPLTSFTVSNTGHKVHRYLGTLGPKLYFLRLPKSEKKTEDEYIAQINSDFDEKVKEIEKALFEYLKWFEMWPEEKKNTATLLI